MKIQPVKLIKLVVTTVVGAGTAKIAHDIIANNVNPAENVKDKVTVTTASVVIGAMAAERTKQWTDETIDQVDKLIRQLRGLPTITEE